jgi:outer membrane protein assembly factor BamB
MRKAILIGVLLAAAGLTAGAQSDWPQWRGANGDGVSAETSWNPMALQGSAKILWKRDVGVGYSSPSVQGGRLFVMGSNDSHLVVSCLDASSGTLLWATEIKSLLEPEATPVVDGDRLYCLHQDGALFCLATSNGATIWSRNLALDLQAERPRQGWAASPVVAGDLLLVNANNKLSAVDKFSGKLRWEIEDDVPLMSWGSYATPVVASVGAAKYAFFLGPSTLFAVDVATGKAAWSFSHRDPRHPAADPIVSGGSVFVTLFEGDALIDATGTEPRVEWRSTDQAGRLHPAVLVGGYVYGTVLPSEFFTMAWEGFKETPLPLRCLDWKTGKVMWEKAMGYVILSAAGDKLIMIELNGTLHVVEATSKEYREIATTRVLAEGTGPRTFAVPPVLCNGKLYCRNYAGELTCIDVGS